MAGYKHYQLKNKSFDDIQKLFDKVMKRVNTFVDMDTELVEGEELEQESSKKRKLEEDKESKELKKCLEIVPDDGDDVTIDATPLSTKSPTITMLEHHVNDIVWKNQQGLVKVMNWKLYNSYGVHCVTMQSILYYLLVEKMYPLTNHTVHQMFNDVKLQVDYECEMAFELLKLVKK
ncbi:hypothetical protein Tco_1279539 [Tanacetum coccineum]